MDESKIAQFGPWVLAVIASIFALLFRRELGRVDGMLERIAAMERSSVTRAELDERLQRMHQENKEVLERIEEKLDESREDSHRERHAVSKELNDLKVAMARAARPGSGAVI